MTRRRQRWKNLGLKQISKQRRNFLADIFVHEVALIVREGVKIVREKNENSYVA